MKKSPQEQLEDSLNIQCADGNWNVDPYMHGMANGMIFAMSLLKNEEPKYLEAPKQWLADKTEIYFEAIETFGVPGQVDMLIEEMAELTQALLKWRRGKMNAMDNVCEEVADVEIMLAQIKTGLNWQSIERNKYLKLERLKTRLSEHKKNA